MGVEQDTSTAPPAPLVASRAPQAQQEQRVPEESASRRCWSSFGRMACSPGTWPERIMCVLFWLAVIAACVVVFAVLLPKALAAPMGKLIQMILRRFTKPQLMGIIIGAIALLPLTIVIPAQPFAWIAGMVFDFGSAFGLVMLGSFIGMSMQYWLARYVFKTRVKRHLAKRRKDGISVALRAVDIAGPWKVLALVRLGPSPYATMNYVFGVVPAIKYHQYIIASMVCISHHRALQVFFGRAMPTLADLFSGQPVGNIGPAIYRFAVLALGIALCVVIVILAKRALKKIELQELEREAQEAQAEAAAQAAAAAEEGGGGPAAAAAAQALHSKGRDSMDSLTASKTPLPLAVQGKVAAAAAAGGSAGAGAAAGSPSASHSSSSGDLQVILVDQDAATTAASTPAPNSSMSFSGASAHSGLIPTAQAPPAALESEPSASGASRLGSISSLRGLWSSTFTRSG